MLCVVRMGEAFVPKNPLPPQTTIFFAFAIGQTLTLEKRAFFFARADGFYGVDMEVSKGSLAEINGGILAEPHARWTSNEYVDRKGALDTTMLPLCTSRI